MYNICFSKKIEKQEEYNVLLRDAFVKPFLHVKKHVLMYLIGFGLFTIICWLVGDFRINDFFVHYFSIIISAIALFLFIVFMAISQYVYFFVRIKTAKYLGILNDNYTESHVLIFGDGLFSVVKNNVSIILSTISCFAILLFYVAILFIFEKIPVCGEIIGRYI